MDWISKGLTRLHQGIPQSLETCFSFLRQEFEIPLKTFLSNIGKVTLATSGGHRGSGPCAAIKEIVQQLLALALQLLEQNEPACSPLGADRSTLF